jgi:hypothetical protein
MVTSMDKHERDQWRKHKVMFPIYDDVDAIAALYAGHGSFAVVRHGNDFKVPGFIPLTPRHMQARNWRALYWLGVKLLRPWFSATQSLPTEWFMYGDPHRDTGERRREADFA